MTNPFPRFPWLGKTTLLLRLAALLFLFGGLVAFVGGFFAGPFGDFASRLSQNAVLFSATLAVPAVLVGLSVLIELSGKSESNSYRGYDVMMDVKNALEAQARILRDMAENVQLSDAARSIAHREREQAVLRQAINEDIIREDWEAAYYLVEQLERRFGYKLEAEQLRNQIETSRSSLIDRKIEEAIEQIKTAIAAHDWERARRSAEQLVRHHPKHPKASELPGEIESRRGEHKRRLLKDWDQAVQRDDVDNGITILKELDQYLTPSEAEALKEAARDVFRAKLHNLGVQMHLAVSEGQWDSALQIAEQIMSEFPNSRMAAEVHQKHDALRARAEKNRLADAAAP